MYCCDYSSDRPIQGCDLSAAPVLLHCCQYVSSVLFSHITTCLLVKSHFMELLLLLCMFTALDILQQAPTHELITTLVVPKMAAQWFSVGLQWGINIDKLHAIGKEFPASAHNCCSQMFESWLQNTPGTGDMPRTWATVLEAVRKYYGEGVTDQITAELQSRTLKEFGVQSVSMHQFVQQ